MIAGAYTAGCEANRRGCDRELVIGTESGVVGSLKGLVDGTLGEILGGIGEASGFVDVKGTIRKLLVLNDLFGGSGRYSGSVYANVIQ